jgi:hypothetical protein
MILLASKSMGIHVNLLKTPRIFHECLLDMCRSIIALRSKKKTGRKLSTPTNTLRPGRRNSHA